MAQGKLSIFLSTSCCFPSLLLSLFSHRIPLGQISWGLDEQIILGLTDSPEIQETCIFNPICVINLCCNLIYHFISVSLVTLCLSHLMSLCCSICLWCHNRQPGPVPPAKVCLCCCDLIYLTLSHWCTVFLLGKTERTCLFCTGHAREGFGGQATTLWQTCLHPHSRVI